MTGDFIDYRTHPNNMKKSYPIYQYLSLIFTTVICNILGVILRSFIKCRKAIIPEKIKKIVVVCFGGIGNHLMLLPTLSSIKKKYPDIKIHLVVSNETCAKILRENSEISRISIKNISKIKGLVDLYRYGKLLKKEKPEIIILASGIEPMRGSLIAYFSRAKIRIGESWKGRGFLYTHSIKVNSMICEKDQNLKLIGLLNVPIDYPKITICLSREEKIAARKWLSAVTKNTDNKVLGIHPGSGVEQRWKRWDFENFLAVGRIMAAKEKIKVVLFLGPDEQELRLQAEEKGKNSSILISGDDGVREVAGKISCCDLFFSNDSGLRQIAVALNIKTVGIFGPTSTEKNFISGPKHKAIKANNILCSPCHYTNWWLNCGSTMPCLSGISVEHAACTLEKFITLS
jgi:heptosyltransferase-1